MHNSWAVELDCWRDIRTQRNSEDVLKYSLPHSYRVDKVGPLITQLRDLLLALALYPDVSLTISPLGIFSPQQQMCHQTSAHEEYAQVSQHHPMTCQVSWLLFRKVYIGTHYTLYNY